MDNFLRKSSKTIPANFAQAKKLLQKLFGLNEEAWYICEFIFIMKVFRRVEEFFENDLHICKYSEQHLLACLLNIPLPKLKSLQNELNTCGIIKLEQRGYTGEADFPDSIYSLWEKKTNYEKLFCQPLKTEESIPLQDFALSPETIAHAKALLQQTGQQPVHILLYGAPGTGKTSFAHSLATDCGVKAWAIPSQDSEKNDEREHDRRRSIIACLHMAAKHDKAFVLVDEAERILSTKYTIFSDGMDKSWINTLLEKPGQRIIWITNHVWHIDPAVKRRFTLSIHFEELGRKERRAMWEQVLIKNKVQSRMDEVTLDRLINDYNVSVAVIDGALKQAKQLCGRKRSDFIQTVEKILQAHETLCRNGIKQNRKIQSAPDYTEEGVCLEGSLSNLLAKCRKADQLMRQQKNLTPGSGTMLFYGPPGTGKTALARYIAEQLERECMVKRASDLKSPFVGVTEQNIAKAFRQAEQEGAVLVIDEADSFIYSRDIAVRSWETSEVNEFLTALEECRCFCICTTNRRENLDSAAMRRFSFKVEFNYAKSEQVAALYDKLLAPLAQGTLTEQQQYELLRMERLTPGDFHAVRSQYNSLFSLDDQPEHMELIAALAKEQSLKLETGKACIGFN